MHKETIVISVGGSLIAPDELDTTFLKKLHSIILSYLEAKHRIVLITGGGKTARKYQQAASKVAKLDPDDLDWLGIHATRLNAHLVRTIFREVAYPVIITNPDEVLDVPKSARLIVAAGYRPGASTDLRAVQIAQHAKATKLINLSNIDYVYTADPRKDKNAKPIKTIGWHDFRALLPEDWDPGLSAPFDPVAAKLAQKLELEVAVINGAKLTELAKYLEGKPFKGTVVG
jgi:uridylate kinase